MVVTYSTVFAMLPLASSLSQLLNAAAALDELLPDDQPARQGTTHYHAPSPSCGRRIYSSKQISFVRWLQHAYRESRRRLRRLITEGTHPLVCGPPQWHRAAVAGEHPTPPLPPRRAAGIGAASLTEELRQRRWDFYFGQAPTATLIRPMTGEVVGLLRAACAFTTKDSFPSEVKGVHQAAGWSRPLGSLCDRMLRHVLPPWRNDTRKMQCGNGKNLVGELVFKAVRDERNRVLHVGAFLSKLYKAMTGSKPRVVVGGGSAGGVNHGVERLHGEHCNIDIAHQPSFIKAFGDARFRLGDATDAAMYERELQVPGTIGMYYTLDCQLYSTINKAIGQR